MYIWKFKNTFAFNVELSFNKLIQVVIKKCSLFTGGNGDVENLDPDVQDYTTDEDYNDVFDATTNGYVIKIFFHFSTPNTIISMTISIEGQLFKNDTIPLHDPQFFLFPSFECASHINK